MKKLIVCLLPTLALAACSSDDGPLSPSTGGGGGGNSITLSAPSAASPLTDEQWGFLEQPMTLTVNNSTVTGRASTSPVTYEFEMASDEGFANIVFSQKGVAEGSGGRTTSGPVSRQSVPGFFWWRARSTNGTSTSADSAKVKFELEPQGGHVSPVGYDDGAGTPRNEEYALAIIEGTGAEFPYTLAVFQDQEDAELAAEELLLRIIWHLKLAGFDAARQRNPSGAISRDKLNVFIRQTWRTYDIFRLGFRNVATQISGLDRVFPENPLAHDGIPD
jgi:hypothetical protein